jgi:hypothetical protein
MKRIIARRLDPRVGYEAQLYKNEPRSIQMEIRDDGELYTRWGPVIEHRIEGQEVHMRSRSTANQREEDFIIPLAELERLQRAAYWQRLPDERPTAYWRKLSREGYATLALRPDPAGKFRGDYNLLTIYQCIHWFDDRRCFTSAEEFFSGEGSEQAFDQASIWSQQVEAGELRPLARIQFVDVPLAVGMTVKILDGGLNNKPVRLGDQPRSLRGKEGVIVEEWERGRTWGMDANGQWRDDGGHWYIECEGERLRYSMRGDQGMSGGKEISASYFILSDLDTSPNLDRQGQVIHEQQYNEADRYELSKHLDHLAKHAGYSTIHFVNDASLLALLPNYRIIEHPHNKKEG